ncbi:MAG: hypothetical protein IPM55_18000 [Acidobacteria bacterium]|nr:hypothetical protein [Acidobacteriota bacterium]
MAGIAREGFVADLRGRGCREGVVTAARYSPAQSFESVGPDNSEPFLDRLTNITAAMCGDTFASLIQEKRSDVKTHARLLHHPKVVGCGMVGEVSLLLLLYLSSSFGQNGRFRLAEAIVIDFSGLAAYGIALLLSLEVAAEYRRAP